MRVLAVAHNLLFPLHDGGSGHLLNLLMGFVRLGCEVVYYARNPRSLNPESAEVGAAITRLEAAGTHVQLPSKELSFEQFMAAHGTTFDLALLWPEGTAMNCFATVKQYAPQAKIIFNTIDLAHIRLFRKAKLEGTLPAIQSAIQAKRRESWLAREADCTLVVSEPERAVLQALCPGAEIRVVPHVVVPMSDTPPFAARSGLLFVGSFPYAANGDAVLYFVEQILPQVRATIPDVELYVVGASPPPEIKALASEHIHVTGYVEELMPFYGRARLAIAPLRYGAGVKNKILHSMAHGLPVVTTSIGAEGMPLVDGVNARIADDPAIFAEAVVQLHEDEAQWARVAAEMPGTLAAHFSQARLDETLGELLHTVAAQRQSMVVHG